MQAIFIGVTSLVVDVCGLVYFLGIGIGIHYILLVVNVLLSVSTHLKKSIGLIISFAMIAFFTAILILFGNGDSFYTIPGRHILFFHEINIILAFTVLSLSFYRYHKALKTVEAELRRYHGHAVEMANTDQLTNLPNRRNVEDELQLIMKCSQSEEGDSGVAIALGDLDNFKQVNDTFGHQCGDEVLKEMAYRFKKSIRNYDFLGRWGGEEFIFVLKNTSLDQARDTMERIRINSTSAPVKCGDNLLEVTVTFGVSYCRIGDTRDALFERVDKLLYQGKESGKNRVMADSDNETPTDH